MAIKTKVMERKPLNFWERTYLPEVLKGMKITLVNLFSKPITLEYPEERPVLPEKYRGAPTLVKDQFGREKCVSCQLCEFVCPPKAIRITPGSIDENDPDANVEKRPKEFEINMLRCIYCGLCEEVCPEEAIILQDVFTINSYDRASAVHNKAKLYEMGGTLPDRHLKWQKKREAAEHGNEH